MPDKPILFSDPMVRALLEGRKAKGTYDATIEALEKLAKEIGP